MVLESFFSPKSVAIVGASRQKSKVGYEILASIMGAGYKGKFEVLSGPRIDPTSARTGDYYRSSEDCAGDYAAVCKDWDKGSYRYYCGV